MKFFNNFLGKKEIIIGSPMTGQCISIREVSDPTFKEELLGKGVAIIPSDGRIYAPADGKIAMIFPTGHAITMVTQDGVELLIHFGMDTVKLNGKYFTIKGKEGESVKKGDLLIEVDIAEIEREGYEITTPIVVTNSSDFSNIIPQIGKVEAGELVMEIRK